DETGGTTVNDSSPNRNNGSFTNPAATNAPTWASSGALIYSSPPGPVVLTVTNTADSGPGSLRQAILDANALSGGLPITIAFNIPTADPNFLDDDSLLTGGDLAADAFFIRPATPLPALTRASVTIDGRTQTSFTGDSNPFG